MFFCGRGEYHKFINYITGMISIIGTAVNRLIKYFTNEKLYIDFKEREVDSRDLFTALQSLLNTV